MPRGLGGERNVLPDLVGACQAEPRQAHHELAHPGTVGEPSAGHRWLRHPGVGARRTPARHLRRDAYRCRHQQELTTAHLPAHRAPLYVETQPLWGGRSLPRPQDESMYEQTLYVRSPTSVSYTHLTLP